MFDASSSGNLLWRVTLAVAKTINIGDVVDFPAGTLSFQMDTEIANKVVNRSKMSVTGTLGTGNHDPRASQMGDTLRPKIVARLSAEGIIPAEARATSLNVPLPAAA